MFAADVTLIVFVNAKALTMSFSEVPPPPLTFDETVVAVEVDPALYITYPLFLEPLKSTTAPLPIMVTLLFPFK
jgi:hypothetical protein